MALPFNRITAIAGAEIRFRFRKTAAVVAWLIVAASVYLIIPDPRSGWALMRINGMRALYNSAAVALGTAIFCSIILTLAGFYLVSNSLKRDIVSRTGAIIGATPITNWEYIGGKFIGNSIYLATIPLACMISAMLMFLVRGESSLEPIVFISTYIWLTVPVVVFCSAIAVSFESLPILSGRFGDVFYFFAWAGMLSFPAVITINHASAWISAFDVSGLSLVIRDMQEQFHTEELTIGGATIDPLRPTILFPGISWSVENIVWRTFSLFIFTLFFVGLATLWFHRFNPDRIKSSTRSERPNIMGKLLLRVKPVMRIFQKFIVSGNAAPSPLRADVFMTFMLSPLVVVAVTIFLILSLSTDLGTLQSGILPAMIVVLVISLADLTSRDETSGIQNLLYTAPRIKSGYVVWKFFSALILTICFTLIPIIRFLFNVPGVAVSLCIGSILIAAGAVGFGILTGSRKFFIAIFLMLLYIALNAKNVPMFDFAGFLGVATVGVQIMYGAIAIGIMVVAYFRHHVRANV